MATKTPDEVKQAAAATAEPEYSGALLVDGKTYTIKGVDKLIKDYDEKEM